MADLAEHVARLARLLAPAPQRDDAVGAELVAAVDDRHERRRSRRRAEGLGPELALGDVALAAAALQRRVEHGLELLRPRPHVDPREAPFEGRALRVALGPDHAAHDGDLQLLAALAALVQVVEPPVGAVLGVLPHGARVDDGEVGAVRVVGGGVPDLLEPGDELEGVGLVHLTAEGPDMVGRHGSPLGVVDAVGGACVAEGVGFEPTIPRRDKRLAGARTRPLCDPSRVIVGV